MQPGRNNEMEIKVFKETQLIKSARKLHFSKEYNTINKQVVEEKISQLSEMTQEKQIFSC